MTSMTTGKEDLFLNNTINSSENQCACFQICNYDYNNNSSGDETVTTKKEKKGVIKMSCTKIELMKASTKIKPQLKRPSG